MHTCLSEREREEKVTLSIPLFLKNSLKRRQKESWRERESCWFAIWHDDVDDEDDDDEDGGIQSGGGCMVVWWWCSYNNEAFYNFFFPLLP